MHDLFVDLSVPGREDHLVVLDAVVPHLDVVLNRVFKKNDILVHHRKRTRQHVAVDLTQRFAVQKDFSAPGLVQTGNQFGKGGLSAAGGADKRDTLAGLQLQVKILDQRFGQRGITKGHVAHAETSAELRVFLLRLLPGLGN